MSFTVSTSSAVETAVRETRRSFMKDYKSVSSSEDIQINKLIHKLRPRSEVVFVQTSHD